MEIDNRPKWLISIQAPETSPIPIEIDGQNYEYTVVSDEVEEDRMPYVVGYTQDGFLMISQKVPLLERPFILTHEVRERKKFATLPEEQRCLASLQLELEDFKRKYPDKYEKYIASRFNFFDSLVSYYQTETQAALAVTLDFRQGILFARDYLHTIFASRN